MPETEPRRPFRILPPTWLLLLLLAGLAALAVYVIERAELPPRQLGPYARHRASGHNPLIVGVGDTLGRLLLRADRGSERVHAMPALLLGAQPAVLGRGALVSTPPRFARVILVATPADVLTALAQARPGDVITLLPGVYRFSGRGYLAARQAGLPHAPITVRAERAGSVRLEFAMDEGFLVSAPYWIFENLHIRGTCSEQSDCEHAFHVVGKAAHFVARNNTVSDFNAHFKINLQDGFAPDGGLLEQNTLTNSSVRQTEHPVTPIDLVGASGWLMRANLISDFVRSGGDRVSYGGFAKGGGAGNRFERNVVLCELHLHGFPGQRVGLSLGGGGTEVQYCRDRRCITEQDGGVIESNLIASCSDEGIYLNRAATSRVAHNTLIDTAGMMVRHPESSADVHANLVDGTIRGSKRAVLRMSDNVETSFLHLYLGVHPVRALFAAPALLDLGWKKDSPRGMRDEPATPDLCGVPRRVRARIGAFEDFAPCRAN